MTAQAEMDRKPFFERSLKWVAAVTAILSLIFAVQKLTQAIADNNDRSRRIEELVEVAERQQSARDYSLAWESLNNANKLAESGGTFARLLGDLDADSKRIHVARESLGMAWLDDISVPSGQGFSSTVEKLMPTLDEGVLTSSGSRKGDLLAHIGWGYFLRSRDGHLQVDPVAQYEQAVVADPANPFAHAYWGHWILWNGGTFQQANEHFSKALNAGREKKRVRELQLSAFRNRSSGGDAQYLSAIVDMLKSNDMPDSPARKLAVWNIERACAPQAQELLNEYSQAVSKTDLKFAYEKLTEQPESDGDRTKREKCLATLNRQ